MRHLRIINLDRFDVIIGLSIATLIVAIVVIVLLGDQVGISVQSFGPVDSASSRAAIQIAFDEPINGADLQQRFSIEPPIQGSLSVSGQQAIFRPAAPLPPDHDYTVSLRAGLTGTSGKVVKHDLRWQFRVRQPRIVYLGPVDKLVQNLYVVDPSAPDKPQQLTSSDSGIVGYDITPDGSKIVYSEIEYNESQSYGTTRLFVFDVASGESHLVYACNAACTNLAWRPDGTMVAFQRVDLNDSIGASPGAPRVWVYDIATNTARPLFTDNQKLGYTPRWSSDGSKLAVYSASEGGVIIHNFVDSNDLSIPVKDGELGTFSPDGRWLYYPKIVVLNGGMGAVHLVLIDLSTAPYALHSLVPDTAVVSEAEATWRADSKALIVARQPPARKLTEGSTLYNVDVATGAATLLVPDESNAQNSLSLSPTNDLLMFQRIKLGEAAAHPTLWLYNFANGDFKQIAENFTLPGWLP